MNFTESELSIAKSVNLCQVAASLGYTVKRVGKYHTLKEMDSIRIYNRTNWFRWSRQYDKGENGGSQIDFLRVFAGMEVKDAVFWLLDFAGYQKTGENLLLKFQNQIPKIEVQREFILPIAAIDNSYLYDYLNRKRCISIAVIDYFIKKELIYESSHYHNVVFKGNDSEGITRFASMRGVFDKEGKSFKCDVAGNDKRYGFNEVNIESTHLIVFEAAIDLMSYVDIFHDYETNKLALGMLSDAPIETFLKEHKAVRHIKLCLDNDNPGRTATSQITEKYSALGYEIEDFPPPKMYKDYNEWLKETRSIIRYRNTISKREKDIGILYQKAKKI